MIEKQVLAGDGPGVGMIAKSSRRDVYSSEFGDVKDAGLVADVRELVGASDLLLLLAVDNRQLRKFEIAILLEGEVNRLREG